MSVTSATLQKTLKAKPQHHLHLYNPLQKYQLKAGIVKMKFCRERADKVTKPMKNSNIRVLHIFMFKTGSHTETTNPRIFEEVRSRQVPNSF